MALFAFLPETARACTSGESLPAEIEESLCVVHDLMGLDRPLKLTVDLKVPRFVASRGSDPVYDPDPHYALGFSPARLDGDHWGVVATFTHELAHLMQFRDLGGSVHGVRAHYGSTQALELAADFTMGCVWAALFPDAPIAHFQANYMLGGSFAALDREFKDFHGRPDQRSSAFRYAIFGYPELCTFDTAMHDGFRDFVWPELSRDW